MFPFPLCLGSDNHPCLQPAFSILASELAGSVIFNRFLSQNTWGKEQALPSVFMALFSIDFRRWRKAYKILPGKGNQSSEYVPPHSLYHIRHLCSGACCPKWWATGQKCCCRLELVGDVRFQVCWKCRIQVFLNQNLHFNWILILKSKKHCSFIIRIQWNTTDLMV